MAFVLIPLLVKVGYIATALTGAEFIMSGVEKTTGIPVASAFAKVSERAVNKVRSTIEGAAFGASLAANRAAQTVGLDKSVVVSGGLSSLLPTALVGATEERVITKQIAQAEQSARSASIRSRALAGIDNLKSRVMARLAGFSLALCARCKNLEGQDARRVAKRALDVATLAREEVTEVRKLLAESRAVGSEEVSLYSDLLDEATQEYEPDFAILLERFVTDSAYGEEEPDAEEVAGHSCKGAGNCGCSSCSHSHDENDVSGSGAESEYYGPWGGLTSSDDDNMAAGFEALFATQSCSTGSCGVR